MKLLPTLCRSHSSLITESVHSIDVSCISESSSKIGSESSSTMGSQRIMKVRTLKESLEAKSKINNEEQRKMYLLRRKLKILELHNNETVKENETECETKIEEQYIDTEALDVGGSFDLSLSVTFGHVQVREYPIILGDNTAVSEGPPLSIDWNYTTDIDVFTVEQFEASRPVKRSFREMIMPVNHRMECLIRCGVSTADMQKRIQEVNKKRLERLETSATLYRSDFHESMEKVKRRFGNFFTQKKRKERELMEHSKTLMETQRDEVNLKASEEEEFLATFIRDNNEEGVITNIMTN